jgi:hypothetical protein
MLRSGTFSMSHIPSLASEPPVQSTDLIASPWKLLKRDYVLLPVIFIMTTIAILLGGEVTARLLYPQDDAAEPCEYATPAGVRYHPMCTSRTKVWEGPWITQHFNDCGYRSAESCAPRPVGSLRIVVVGSSTARGALVDYADSFAARASAALSKRCSGLVDFQNLGTEPPEVDGIDRRMPEILSLQPAAIVLVLGTFDIVHLKDRPPVIGQEPPASFFNLRTLIERLRASRLFLLMQYYLYRDPTFQVRAFLLNGDPADYVRTPLSPAWQKRVADIGGLFERIKARAGSIPVLVFSVPERAQAALAGRVTDSPNIDPLILGTALKQAADRHGVQFFDTTQEFASAPDFQSLYYLTDGHPKAGGHAALATVVEGALLSEPTFATCTPR